MRGKRRGGAGKPEKEVVAIEVREVLTGKRRLEFTGKILGILGGYLEGSKRADIAEDGATELGRKMRQMLMGKAEASRVFPRFRKKGRERVWSGKRRKLVHIDVEQPGRPRCTGTLFLRHPGLCG